MSSGYNVMIMQNTIVILCLGLLSARKARVSARDRTKMATHEINMYNDKLRR